MSEGAAEEQSPLPMAQCLFSLSVERWVRRHSYKYEVARSKEGGVYPLLQLRRNQCYCMREKEKKSDTTMADASGKSMGIENRKRRW